MEEGDLDEECADEDQIRDQVGRLHHRAVLDEDQREVRLFQDLDSRVCCSVLDGACVERM